MGARYTGIADPFDLVAAKQRIDPVVADQVALAVLLCLDAAKRGAAPATLSNTLTKHLLTSVAIWSQLGNKPHYLVGVNAWNALRKASVRPTALLDLTTGEDAAIRLAISYYLRALPLLEVGAMTRAQERAFAQLRH